jgi:subtilisin family serine protease
VVLVLALLTVGVAGTGITARPASAAPAATQPTLDEQLRALEAEIDARLRAYPLLAADAAVALDELGNATWELFFGTWCSTADRLQAATAALDHAESIAPAEVRPVVLAVAAEVARMQAFVLAVNPEMCDRPDVFHVDPDVHPTTPPMTDDVDGAATPVGAIADADGRLDQFVSNEILLETGDAAKLQAFLSRFGGRVIETIPVEGDEALDSQPQHVIRMDPARLSDTSRLAADLEAVDPGNSGEIMLASDQQTLRLLATVARARVEGYAVELDLVVAPDDVATGATADSPVACALPMPCGAVGWNPNAFTWDYFTDGSVQDIEVTTAWQLLQRAGKLTPSVPVGVIDAGFNAGPNGDFPVNHDGQSAGPRLAATDTAHRSHGTKVVDTIAGRLDNGVGAAGVAGPVIGKLATVNFGDPANVRRATRALRRLNRAGVKIISMSFGMDIRARYRRMGLQRFERVLRRLAGNGILLVAAAGNSGTDIDHEKCGLAGRRCRERRDLVPCESSGVVCVGALAPGSLAKADYSNWGHRDVDIWAPGSVFTGRTVDCIGCETQWFDGTSAATPFAAGVAALIWAGNPVLTAGGVGDILSRTARVVNAGEVSRVVHAGGAVAEAVGPEVRIEAPANGQTFTAGTPIAARAVAFDDGLGTPVIDWYVSELKVGTGASTTITLAEGTWPLIAQARFPDGTIRSAVVVVRVTRPPGG